MSLNNMKYQFHVYIGPSASNTLRVSLPSFNDNGAPVKFAITSLIGQLSNADPAVNVSSAISIHCPQLANEHSYWQDGNGKVWNDLIEMSAVNSQFISNPFNSIINDNALGFILPTYMRDNYELTFYARDQDGDLLTNLKYAVICCDIYQSQI